MKPTTLILLLFSLAQLSFGADSIVLQLKWKPQFQFAGYYAAQQQGFYEAEGLDVEIKPAEPGTFVIPEVVSGRAQFGTAMPDLLLKHHQGEPVVVVAPIFQHSPYVLVARKDRVGEELSSLKGKRIMKREHGADELTAMLKTAGIDSSNSELLPLSWDWNDLANGSVDAYAFYSTDLPAFLEQHDTIEFRVFSPINYGIDFYGDCLITSQKYLKSNRKQVEAFLRASRKGWAYALANPIEVIIYMKSLYDIEMTQEELLKEAEKTRELTLFRFIEVGHSSNSRWEHIAETFKHLEMLPEEYDFDTTMIYSPLADTRIPHWLAQFIVMLLILIMLILIFNYRLRREMDKKVTELRQSEGMFRTIFDNSTQLITVLDSEGKVKAANPTSLAMIGSIEEDVYDVEFWKTPWWRHSSTLQTELKKRIESASEMNGETFQTEATHIDSNGKVRVVDFTLTPVMHNGSSEYIIAVGYDMSHIHEIEERDRHLQKMEAIGTLAGGIAHDFNNILAGLFGFLDLASLEEHDNVQLHEAHEEIRSAADRARDLVSQILTYSRKGGVDREPICFAHTVEEAMKLIRSSIPSSISIDMRLNSDDYILANSTQIHQVVMNICTNAYHAMQAQKSGLLSVYLDTVDYNEELLELHPGLPEGVYIQLEISDTGSGMDSSTSEQVFNPYFTTKIAGKGTGLGLSLVHSIITGHDGNITLSSKPGVGTTFILLFPTIEYTPETIIAETRSDAELDNASVQIMFVDDEEMIVRSATRYLERAGFQVESFLDSSEALSAFEENPAKYSVVISDMTMPLLDGVEFLQEVHHVRSDVPMILCSGFNQREPELREEMPEISHFLQKPIAMNDLVDVVRNLVSKERE